MDDFGGFIGGVLILALLACPFYAWYLYHQNQQLNAALNQANANIESLNYEIDQANGDIDEVNDQINDAQDMAWNDYDTMGTTLEDLSPVNDIFYTYPTVSSSTAGN